jgi:hypothetical protein
VKRVGRSSAAASDERTHSTSHSPPLILYRHLTICDHSHASVTTASMLSSMLSPPSSCTRDTPRTQRSLSAPSSIESHLE